MSKLFLPRFEYPKRSVDDWLDRIQHAEGKDAIDALWCVYWAGDRSRDVVERLQSLYAKSTGTLTREIDVVLTQWDIPHSPPPPWWSNEVPGGPSTADEIDAHIALRCGARTEDIRVILDDASWRQDPEVPLYLAPSGLFAPPLRTTGATDAELLRELEDTDRVSQAEAAVTLLLRRQEVTHVLKVLAARDESDPATIRAPDEIEWRGFSFGSQERGTPLLMNEVEFGAGRNWYRWASATRIWPAEKTTRLALSWARRFAGNEAVKLAGLALVSTPPDPSPRVVKRYEVQTPELGDNTTSDSAERTERLVRQLETRLALQQSPEPALPELLAVVEPEYVEEDAIGAGDRYFGFLWWLDGHTFSDPRVTEWCLSIVTSKWPFAAHLDSAARYLSRQTLDRRQQAILCRYDETAIAYSRRQAPLIEPQVFAQQGEAAVEVAAYLRLEAQVRQDLEMLDALLAIARPSPRDTEMVLAALEHGVATERRKAVEIIEARRLDTPAIRRAVGDAESDPDAHVRAAVRHLVATLGW